jgi:hypothetical protein
LLADTVTFSKPKASTRNWMAAGALRYRKLGHTTVLAFVEILISSA